MRHGNGHADWKCVSNGHSYVFAYPYSPGHCYTYSVSVSFGYTDSDRQLHAWLVPRADSVFRYRRAASHTAKPDASRTGCDRSGPVRRILRHADPGAVTTVQHRSGLL